MLNKTNLFEYIFNTGITVDVMYDIDYSINKMNKAKTMGEFLFVLLFNLVENPHIFYKEILKGEILITNEIKALCYIEKNTNLYK